MPTRNYRNHVLCRRLLGIGVLLSVLFGHESLQSIASVQPQLLAVHRVLSTASSPTAFSTSLPTFTNRDDVHVSKPQTSPDGRFVATTVVPFGTETAHLARTELFDTTTATVRYRLPGHTPRWYVSANSTELILHLTSADRTVASYLVGETIQPVPIPIQAAASISTGPENSSTVQINREHVASGIDYPTTIRVAHHPSNGCRNVTDWQIDLIPFEEYIARVVPAETPAGWPVAALATQAVAARTYAWHQILAQRTDYDVTDWANFQMMCDERHGNSDTAVAMTAGHYLVASEDTTMQPIVAMYSAENGHPTLTNPNVTYLQGVPDRFALGRERWGHGYGLSQWGAYRRARAGHSYQQILAHYYTNVYLVNGMNPTEPLGTLTGNAAEPTTATEIIPLRTMAPPSVSPRFEITASRGLTTSVIITTPLQSWQPPEPLPHNTLITATLWIDGLAQDHERWRIDHDLPRSVQASDAENLPDLVTQQAVTFSLPYTADLPLMTEGLSWEGEALGHTDNSGTAIVDPLASGGVSWHANPQHHAAGVWYGPYTKALAAGHSYRALFWLRAELPQPTAIATTFPNQVIPLGSLYPDVVLARLDVTDNEGRTMLGLHDLRPRDFGESRQYRAIPVDFHLFASPSGLEFRVAWHGQTALTLDRVEIWRLPDQITAPTTCLLDAGDPCETVGEARFQWMATNPGQIHSLHFRYMDSAGNLGASYPHTVTVVDNEPPQILAFSVPGEWVGSHQVTDPGITVTAILSDAFSGIDSTRTSLSIELDDRSQAGRETTGDGRKDVAFTKPQWTAQAPLVQLSATLTSSHIVPDQTAYYTVTVATYDQAGNYAEAYKQLAIDAIPPTVSITSSVPHDGATSDELRHGVWYLAPVTVTLHSEDDASGVMRMAYTVTKTSGRLGSDRDNFPQAGIETMADSAIVKLAAGGLYTVSAVATDRVGNQSPETLTTFALDLEAPTIVLTQHTVTTDTVHLAWQSRDDGSGVAAVVLETRNGDGGWREFALDRVAPVDGIDIRLHPIQPTAVRARAQDQVGRWSEWVVLELWIASDWIYLPIIHASLANTSLANTSLIE